MPMGSSSRRWAKSISSVACCLYFLLIILQVPLFRVPCRCGFCITPLQVTSSQVIASGILPVSFVKIILYPGAIVNALMTGTSLPSYDNLLVIYNLTDVKEVPASIDFRLFEILAGSYFSVAGAILGLLRQNRLSLFGVLLLLWGLLREAFRQKSTYLDATLEVQVSPIMLVAFFTALLCIKGDVRKIIRSFQAHHSASSTTVLHERIKKRRRDREMKRLEWTVKDINSSKAPRNTKVAQEGIIN